MSSRRRALAVLALCCFAACPRKPVDSPEYEKAFVLYNDLYAKNLDDAYTDPRMLRVVELLQKVDPNSSQAAQAQDLLAKVQKGLSDTKARADRVAADLKAADEPPRFIGSSTPEPPPKAPAPEAGPTAGPALGMTRDEFTSKYGDCFEKRGEYEQGEKRGEAFGLLPACKAKFPTFTDSLVVLIDNRVASLVPLTDVTVRTVDAGGVAPPAPVPAPPAPAAPTTVRIMPGMPRPPNAVPLPPPAKP